jgi:hypothetical protein
MPLCGQAAERTHTHTHTTHTHNTQHTHTFEQVRGVRDTQGAEQIQDPAR